MNLPMLSTEQKLAEIRRLYFTATRGSIQHDIEKALDLLKSIASEDERERATVYMEGLAQMRRDWGGGKSKGGSQRSRGRMQKAKGTGKG